MSGQPLYTTSTAEEATYHILLDLPGEGGKDLAAAGAEWTIYVRSEGILCMSCICLLGCSMQAQPPSMATSESQWIHIYPHTLCFVSQSRLVKNIAHAECGHASPDHSPTGRNAATSDL